MERINGIIININDTVYTRFFFLSFIYKNMTQETISIWVVIKNLLYIPAVFVGISMQTYTILAVLLILDVITGAWRSGVVSGATNFTFTISAGLRQLMIAASLQPSASAATGEEYMILFD